MADGYELTDFCEALQAEIKLWNAATVLNGGAGEKFGSTGQRVFNMPPENEKVGREQPIIYVESRGMAGSIYAAKGKPEQTGGTFLYDMQVDALVIIQARGTWVYKSKEMRDWTSLLRKWLEENGANGYCQAFYCGETTTVAFESTKERGGIKRWQIPVSGVREVIRTVSF